MFGLSFIELVCSCINNVTSVCVSRDLRTTWYGKSFPASTDNIYRWPREIAAS